MSKKRILNFTSRKKRDNMLTWNNVNVPRTDLTYKAGLVNMQGGGSDYYFLWCASARDADVDNASTSGVITDPSTRTASTIFAKGLKERITLASNSGLSWRWRRIVFTFKGTAPFFGVTAANPIYAKVNGYQRLYREATAAVNAALTNVLFDGTYNQDWTDQFSAKTHNRILTVLSDKTINIHSGNALGISREYNLYYPLNKNLVYADEEFGGEDASVPFSTLGKPGMGDVLVYDMFRPGLGSSFSDVLNLNSTSTFYWHEK